MAVCVITAVTLESFKVAKYMSFLGCDLEQIYSRAYTALMWLMCCMYFY